MHYETIYVTFAEDSRIILAFGIKYKYMFLALPKLLVCYATVTGYEVIKSVKYATKV